MTKHDILSIGLKLLGVYLLIQAVQALQYFFAWLAQAVAFPTDTATVVGSVLATVVPFVLLIGAAILLIRQSDPIATRMLQNSSASSAGDDHVSAPELQAIAFSVVGLTIIALAIPKIFPLAMTLHYISRTGAGLSNAGISKQMWGSILSVLVQIIIGTILFLRPQGIVNFWRKLQSGRYERRGQQDTAADAASGTAE